jgi:hypothetical protein
MILLIRTVISEPQLLHDVELLIASMITSAKLLKISEMWKG